MSKEAKFVTGSTMRHVVVMSLTSTVGLMSIFLVDLMDMYFLSLLGEVELASAVGYAGSILFFTTSVGIGLSIAMGAFVSRSIGSQDLEQAKQYAINILVFIVLTTVTIVILLWPTIPFFIDLLGAKGRSAELSIAYLRIMVPSMPIMGLAMGSGAILRAVGDPKRQMQSTMFAGLVNAVMDPIFIFGLDLGVEGAAYASVMARFAMLFWAFWPVVKKHNMLGPFHWKCFQKDMVSVVKIAFPAILTNIATPIGTAYVTAAMAKFGDSAVAGMSITARLTPVAFSVVFAASGAIGPIIGQNIGAKQLGRVRSAIKDSILFVGGYVVVVSIMLALAAEGIVWIFKADPDAAEVIRIFCYAVSFTYIFAGATFVGNASFNNLERANFSTLINFGKATVGTIPFVYFGGQWYGAQGILLGQAAGTVLFGIISVVWLQAVVRKLED